MQTYYMADHCFPLVVALQQVDSIHVLFFLWAIAWVFFGRWLCVIQASPWERSLASYVGFFIFVGAWIAGYPAGDLYDGNIPCIYVSTAIACIGLGMAARSIKAPGRRTEDWHEHESIEKLNRLPQVDAGQLEFDLDELRDHCSNVEFVEFKPGELLHWQTPGLDPPRLGAKRLEAYPAVGLAILFAGFGALIGGVNVVATKFGSGVPLPFGGTMLAAIPLGALLGLILGVAVYVYATMFADAPTWVKIDHVQGTIEFFTRRGIVRRKLTEVTRFRVRPTGKEPIVGAALVASFADTSAELLKSDQCFNRRDHALVQLFPFTELLADSIAVPFDRPELDNRPFVKPGPTRILQARFVLPFLAIAVVAIYFIARAL